MPVYEYQAIAKSGKNTKGVIDADSAAAARRKLREQNLYPTAIQETFGKAGPTTDNKEGGIGFGRISARDVALMTRQMAVLLDAGMPLVGALSALLEQTQNARLRKTVYDVRDKVNTGTTLANALKDHPEVFSRLHVNMVGAGESSGALEQVLFRLADFQERQVKLKNRVVSMLFYPAVMASFGTAMVVMLMIVVVPRIVGVFEKQKMQLPNVTKALMLICDVLSNYWWAIVIALMGVYVLWRLWVGRPQGRRNWDRFKLKAPLFGPLYTKMVCGRFARTLGTMLQSGLTMMNALDVVKSILQNRVLEDIVEDVKADVRRGRDLSVPLRESGLFPPMLIHMIELGQRSGELETMLVKVADTYDDDVEITVDAIVGLLDPLIIICMGLFVGFLVVAILLPIFEMSQGFG